MNFNKIHYYIFLNNTFFMETEFLYISMADP